MTKLLTGLMGAVLLTACSQAPVHPPVSPGPYPRVAIFTNLGNFVVQLDRQRAPLTVANFLHYVVIQGGGYTQTFTEKKTLAPKYGFLQRHALPPRGAGLFPNESGNGLSNLRGTLGMARDEDPHSATAQFYINLADNRKLDPRPDRWGYAVFGKVIEGMAVVDKIAAVPTGKLGPFDKDAPLTPVLIVKAVELQPSLD